MTPKEEAESRREWAALGVDGKTLDAITIKCPPCDPPDRVIE